MYQKVKQSQKVYQIDQTFVVIHFSKGDNDMYDESLLITMVRTKKEIEEELKHTPKRNKLLQRKIKNKLRFVNDSIYTYCGCNYMPIKNSNAFKVYWFYSRESCLDEDILITGTEWYNTIDGFIDFLYLRKNIVFMTKGGNAYDIIR